MEVCNRKSLCSGLQPAPVAAAAGRCSRRCPARATTCWWFAPPSALGCCRLALCSRRRSGNFRADPETSVRATAPQNWSATTCTAHRGSGPPPYACRVGAEQVNTGTSRKLAHLGKESASTPAYERGSSEFNRRSACNGRSRRKKWKETSTPNPTPLKPQSSETRVCTGCAEVVRSLRRVSRYWLAVRGLLTALPLAPTGAPFALAGASPTLLALPKVLRSPAGTLGARAACCARSAPLDRSGALPLRAGD